MQRKRKNPRRAKTSVSSCQGKLETKAERKKRDDTSSYKDCSKTRTVFLTDSIRECLPNVIRQNVEKFLNAIDAESEILRGKNGNHLDAGPRK